jgi:hypothetical protein
VRSEWKLCVRRPVILDRSVALAIQWKHRCTVHWSKHLRVLLTSNYLPKMEKNMIARLLIMAICGASLVLSGCERSVSTDVLTKTAKEIFHGERVPDGHGVVVIDAKLNVYGNNAYVTHKADGSMLVLFRTWQGKGSNLRGYLFTNGPPLEISTEIGVITFSPLGPDGGVPVGTAEVTIDKAIRCYQVSRSLD